MKIDIHRHSHNPRAASLVVRNIFHNQADTIEESGYYSVGLHPWHLTVENLRPNLADIEKMAKHPRTIAIGETGLDKTIDVPMTLQVKAFEEQIKIAKHYNKPMIIHCVKAYNELLDHKIKSKHNLPWIIHWFNASLEMGLQLIEKGFYLSFGYMLFNENSKAYRAFARLPLDKIFLETDDAGYSIEEVYAKASELLSVPEHVIESQIEKNFMDCFGIKI